MLKPFSASTIWSQSEVFSKQNVATFSSESILVFSAFERCCVSIYSTFLKKH